LAVGDTVYVKMEWDIPWEWMRAVVLGYVKTASAYDPSKSVGEHGVKHVVKVFVRETHTTREEGSTDGGLEACWVKMSQVWKADEVESVNGSGSVRNRA